jgi:hypothetical protein
MAALDPEKVAEEFTTVGEGFGPDAKPMAILCAEMRHAIKFAQPFPLPLEDAGSAGAQLVLTEHPARRIVAMRPGTLFYEGEKIEHSQAKAPRP